MIAFPPESESILPPLAGSASLLSKLGFESRAESENSACVHRRLILDSMPAFGRPTCFGEMKMPFVFPSKKWLFTLHKSLIWTAVGLLHCCPNQLKRRGEKWHFVGENGG
jgi:hypothetical protein